MNDLCKIRCIHIEIWRKSLDTGGHDLSEAFDCIDHVYGFDTDALKFIYSYLRGRRQRTKINSS